METTPRILSPHLSTFQHRTVRLMGIVISMSGQSAILDCGGEVTLILNRDSQFIVGHAVDVIGKVMEDLSVKVMVGDDWGKGNRIDMKANQAVVEATHRHKEIFYDD